MTTTAAEPIVDERARFGPLVAQVANWQMIQETRKKVQLPILAHLRGVGAISKGDQLGENELLGLCLEHGLPTWMPEQIMLLRRAEEEASNAVVREWRTHPLAPWAASIKGLGEHSVGILLGYLYGDPLTAYPRRRVGERGNSQIIDEPPYRRSVSQLWSYCGYGNPMLKRREGMSQQDLLALGVPRTKARLHLIAHQLGDLKSGAYRGLYELTKERYRDKKHEHPCRGRGSCGADVGEPWRPNHIRFAALRAVAKRLLADMYDEAKRLRLEGEW